MHTPSGGDYVEVSFYDENGQPCEEANAKRYNITEFKKNGKRIKTTYSA